ncbi:hypothetical protein ACF0H5_006651 [Mactra antiquata]
MASGSDLPKEFDVIVLGTGMPESIAAAAFSRIGQSVLHLDRNDHYSGNWASFNLQGIEKWAKQHQDVTSHKDDLERPDIDESSLLEEGETLVQLPLGNYSFSQTETEYFVPEEDEEDKKAMEEKSAKQTESQIETNNDQVVDNVDEQTKSADVHQATDADGDSNADMKDDKVEKDSVNTDGEKTYEFSETKEGDNGAKTESSDAIEEKLSGQEQIDNDVDAKTETIEGVKDEQNTVEVTENVSGNFNTESAGTENVVSKDEDTVKEKSKSWSQKRMKSEWRRFNMDLSPKVLYSVGDMVELLISSDIAKYCEFKTVTQILTLMDGNLEKVPCSRADVFSSKKVSMLEKRMLMKFLQFCLEYEQKPEEIKDYMDKPFLEFLSSKKLTPTIRHYIQHSIAMATDSMTTSEGLIKMKKFLSSLGRYGNTAFLWSLYGSGELPQSFCRMCAVFGGVYCLRTSVSSLIMDSDNRCVGIITTEGSRIKCKWVVMESTYAPRNYLSVEASEKRLIARAILMTDRPLFTTGQKEQLSFMCLPCSDDGDRPINVLELPPSSMASPLGIYICHLTRQSKPGLKPKDDLLYAVQSLFTKDDDTDVDKPKLLWSLYFTQEDLSLVSPSTAIPDNVILMSGPGSDIDIDSTVLEAKEVFKRVLPDEEFLPKAPNPEDIIYVDDSEAQVADADSQSEFSKSDQSEQDTAQEDQSEQRLQDNDQEDQSDCRKEKDQDCGAKETVDISGNVENSDANV